MSNRANKSKNSIFTSMLSLIRAAPVVGDIVAKVARLPVFSKFQTSKQYWEDRYQKGGNSGPGSYGKLSLFKAKVINDFCEEHGVTSLAELGCGDGSQLELLDIKEYTGVDISQVVITKLNGKYSNNKNRNFLLLADFNKREEKFDACMSLDVIYHLVEDSVFDQHMRQLFDSAMKYVIIYSSNKKDAVVDLHVKHRKFSDWIDKNASHWVSKIEIENPYPFDWKDPRNTSFANFYIYEKIKS